MKRMLLVAACLVLGGLGASLGQLFLRPQPAHCAVADAVREPASYRDVVKKVLPAVVSVEALSKDGRPKGRAEDMQFRDEDAPGRVGFGSGFLVASRGVIVTNNHVVEGADSVLVQLHNGKKFTSRKIKTDPKTDLAIVEVDGKDLPTLEFGDSDQMEIGDRVLAIGAPFGLSGTVTHGIVSSKARALRVNAYEDFLQTDAAINPGNSGGPLVNLDGKVIGINSAIKSRTGGFQGIGLAISSNLGKGIVEVLLRDGAVKRGYLGVGVKDVDDAAAKELGLKEATGVKVTRLVPDAPGEKGGLKLDDVILEVADKTVRDSRDLQFAVASLPLGKAADVVIQRAGQKRTLRVTVEEQPREFAPNPKTPAPRVPEVGKGAIDVERFGLALADLTPELGQALGFPEGAKGPLVVQVNRRGIAFAAGVRPGLLVLSVNGNPAATSRAAAAALSNSTRRATLIEVRAAGRERQTLTMREE